MKAKPWSYTHLDDFKNCPRQFYAKRVAKSVVEEKSEQQKWGEFVHKAFEDRQNDGVVLPDSLEAHEKHMLALQNAPGHFFCEQKIAFDRVLKPSHFFDRNVWFRGVIDYLKVNGRSALVEDYKTGKPHGKFEQLELFSIHTFAMYPDVERVVSRYYWTQTYSVTTRIVERSEINPLWGKFTPDLRQLAEAYASDVWQPRPSGLCHGWCPVKDCEFWKPKKKFKG